MSGGFRCSPCACGGHADCTICNPPAVPPCPSCGVGESGTWDTHFDRSLCACGSMHTYCNECGESVEECDFADMRDEPMRDAPATVLEEAARLVDGDRQDAYGPPGENHGCTAAMWNAYLRRRFDAQLAELGTGSFSTADLSLDAFDVTILNILQKCSRLAHSRTRDSLVDIAGYVRNAELVEDDLG